MVQKDLNNNSNTDDTMVAVLSRKEKRKTKKGLQDDNPCSTTSTSDNTTTTSVPCMKKRHSHFTLHSPMHSNEDRATISEHDSLNIQCYAVIDGHGGHVAADYVKRHIAPELFKAISLDNNTDDDIIMLLSQEDVMTSVIKKAFARVDSDFCKWASDHNEDSGACVLMTVIINDVHAFVANCGDCRAIVLSDTSVNRVRPLSTDHTCASASEVKRIRAAGGKVFGGRLDGILEPSRAMGDLDFKSKGRTGWLSSVPEVRYEKLSAGDLIVMGTDGVWDVLTNRNVADQISQLKKENKVHQIAECVVKLARTLQSFDDITVSCIEI